jgi:pimeloyl-ACP methyl ester carboxylesterase
VISRRAVLGVLGTSWATSSALGCDRCGATDVARAPSDRGRSPAASGEAPRAKLESRWRELDLEPSDDYREPQRATVLAKDGDVPLLIALHGAGEVAKGLVGGSRGWRDDYDLDRCEARLRHAPLTKDDFLGFVTAPRLATLNASLAERPYAGLSVVCPFTPRIRDLESARPFATFVAKQLVPRVRRETGLHDTNKIGVDGVSMGGRLALLVGLAHPEWFDAVAALQPAIAVEEAKFFSELAARALAKKKLPLRLVTSEGDFFLDAVRALSEQMGKDGVEHQLLETPGPHDYAWNRGPGSIEMLLWHDRALRGHASP